MYLILRIAHLMLLVTVEIGMGVYSMLKNKPGLIFFIIITF